MQKKQIITTIVVALVFAGGGFFGGMKYAQGKGGNRLLSGQNFQNMTPEQRQQAFGQFRQGGGAGGANGTGTRRNGAAGAGLVAGSVLSKDDKSVTVKLPDGGSKIVFYSSSTNIGKMAQGTAEDLQTGQQVFVQGTTNSDGSVTAQSIQIRPDMPAPANQTNQ